jgi:hypothetical protein
MAQGRQPAAGRHPGRADEVCLDDEGDIELEWLFNDALEADEGSPGAAAGAAEAVPLRSQPVRPGGGGTHDPGGILDQQRAPRRTHPAADAAHLMPPPAGPGLQQHVSQPMQPHAAPGFRCAAAAADAAMQEHEQQPLAIPDSWLLESWEPCQYESSEGHSQLPEYQELEPQQQPQRRPRRTASQPQMEQQPPFLFLEDDLLLGELSPKRKRPRGRPEKASRQYSAAYLARE